MSKNQLKGIIVSDKMDKTVIVKVENIKEHPKYQKRYKSHKRYKAHDEKNEFKAGEKVVIEETRPFSKDKKWKIISEKPKDQNQETENFKEAIADENPAL